MASHPGSQNQTLRTSSDADDDFQDTAAAQTARLASFRRPCSSDPRNGSKRPKVLGASSLTVKEKRREPNPNSLTTDASEKRKKNLYHQTYSKPVRDRPISTPTPVPDPLVSNEITIERNESNPICSQLCEVYMNQCVAGSGITGEKSHHPTNHSTNFVKQKEEEGKWRANTMSIESRLLRSIGTSKPRELSQVFDFDDFELGTPMNELISLCTDNEATVSGSTIDCPVCGKDITDMSEDLRGIHTNNCLEESAGGSSSAEEDMHAFTPLIKEVDGAEVGGVPNIEIGSSKIIEFDTKKSGLKTRSVLECPLCGRDITSLSDQERQVHTNECLDKSTDPEITFPDDVSTADLHPQVVDVNPVLGWLQNLGLSNYEDNFVREEVDWETLQWLTEEDLISMGITALGPRKKIVHALNDLRKRVNDVQDLNLDIPSPSTITNEHKQQDMASIKLITDYFQGIVDRNKPSSSNRQLQGVEKIKKESVHQRVGGRKPANRGKFRDIPSWCSIPGTPFRVDAFLYLRGDCSYWFLTHFHMDHYQGLTKNFCHGKIYCSSITAHLVHMKIGIPWDKLHILPLNEKISIAGVKLTCLDANHCPGAIMILFEPPNGKAVLHTGDFRYSKEMSSNSLLRTCYIHTLILDTTYCNPRYDFPKQEAVIQFVIEAIQAETFNPKTLFLIGSYTIGKEKIFLEVARLLRKKIYTGVAKLRILSCLGFSKEDLQWFTTNDMESQIHVVPMWAISSFKRMKYLSNQYSGRFNLIVSFSPTGWAFGKGKKKTPGHRWQQGTIIRYEVPYSEHCSFTELREFVSLVSPEKIIPSVNNEGPESANALISLLMSGGT